MSQTEKVIRFINALICGHVLAIIAVALNYGDKVGVSLAALGIACAYFSELNYIKGTNYPKFIMSLYAACPVFVALSYLYWLLT